MFVPPPDGALTFGCVPACHNDRLDAGGRVDLTPAIEADQSAKRAAPADAQTLAQKRLSTRAPESLVTTSGVPALAVIERFDVLEDLADQLAAGRLGAAVDHLFAQGRETSRRRRYPSTRRWSPSTGRSRLWRIPARTPETRPGRSDGSRRVPAARVEERLANYLWGAGDSGGALQAARRSVARLDGREPSADRDRALCAEGRMLVMRSRNQEARERLEGSLKVARSIGASSEEAQAFNYLGGALAFLGDYTGGIERLRAAVRIARESGSQARGLSQYENLSEVLAQAGQLGHARDVASEGIAGRP